MAKNFPEHKKDNNLQVQQAQYISKSLHEKKLTFTHIIVEIKNTIKRKL